MKITVFTPTYNRGYILPKLYESLYVQCSNDFEWIIVDDGSNDNTEEIVREWMNIDNGFDIIYKKQPNGGKHRAINAGVKIARGELFFIVDSDDYLLPDAIEKLLQWRSGLDGSHKWAGIAGLRGYTADRCIGGNGRGNKYVDAKNTEREKYHLGGDKAEAYFTDVLRKHPFPEFDGENFLTEEVVWNAIAADGYYIRWFSQIIYICNYLEDGLTKNGDEKNKQNPVGMLCWAKGQLKAFPHSFKKRLHVVYSYYNVVKNAKKISVLSRELGVSRFFCVVAIFLGNIKRKVIG